VTWPETDITTDATGTITDIVTTTDLAIVFVSLQSRSLGGRS
jgi:hypothetical protein